MPRPLNNPKPQQQPQTSEPTLLKKLLEKDKARETRLVLECIRYIVQADFFKPRLVAPKQEKQPKEEEAPVPPQGGDVVCCSTTTGAAADTSDYGEKVVKVEVKSEGCVG